MIWLDMDDVLAPFQVELMKLHSPTVQNRAKHRKPGVWNLASQVDLSNDDFMAPAIARRCAFASTLGKTPWAEELVAFFSAQYGIENVGILTAPYPQHGKPVLDSYTAKMHWVAKNFPQLVSRTVVCPEKLPIASNGVLVDDKEETIQGLRAKGHTAYLWPHIGNSQYHNSQDPLNHFLKVWSNAA